MKRAISILGALALAAGFFTLAAPAAHAYTINCTNVTVGGSANSKWPYNGNTQYCGSVSAGNANSIASSLYGFRGWMIDAYTTSPNHPLDVYLPQVFVFQDKDEYQTYLAERSYPVLNDPPYDSTPAFTAYGGTPLAPLYSVVFIETLSPAGNTTYRGNLAVHETGHQTDFIYQSKLSGTVRASDSTTMTDMIAKDWENLELYTACSNTGLLFRGKKDSDQDWICTSNGSGTSLVAKYSGFSNQEVLEAAFPDIFLESKEIWAEVTAQVSGNADGGQDGLASYFGLSDGKFSCTMTLLRSLHRYGEVPGVSPSPYSYPNGSIGGTNWDCIP
ncbi:MAG: hypothetical protein K8L99_24850 [Anaerolineae bacterium]|nr:hypothetical protein [Anaerolineae bacterium]